MRLGIACALLCILAEPLRSQLAQAPREALEQLAHADADRRQAAQRALVQRPAGSWIGECLRLAESSPREVQLRLVDVLGRKRDSLRPLCELLASGDKATGLATAALRAHFARYAAPAPAVPDNALVFVDSALILDAVPHLCALVDQLIAARRLRLPLLIQASLDRPGSWARRELETGGRAWRLDDVLPKASGPKLVAPIVTVTSAHARIVTRATALTSAADAFVDSWASLFAARSSRSERRRAAINLAALDLTTATALLGTLSDEPGRSGNEEIRAAARVGLAVARLRGSPCRLDAEAVLEQMRNHPEDRLLLGAALRFELDASLAQGRMPSWFIQPTNAKAPASGLVRAIADPVRAAIFSGCGPGPLQSACLEFLRTSCEQQQVAQRLRGLASCCRALSNAGTRLVAKDRGLLLEALRALSGEAASPDDARAADALVTTALELIAAGGDEWLRGLQATDITQLVGRREERGLSVGLALGRAGKRGMSLAMRSLASCSMDAACAMIRGLDRSPPDPSGVEHWWKERELRPGSARLDLVLAALPAPSARRQKLLMPVFGRLRVQRQLLLALRTKGKDKASESARFAQQLGRALGTALLGFEGRVEGKLPSAWLQAWLAEPLGADVFQAAMARCLEERPLLARDLMYRLAKDSDLPAARRVAVAAWLEKRLRSKDRRLGEKLFDRAEPLLAR